jgi:hypothetical protein
MFFEIVIDGSISESLPNEIIIDFDDVCLVVAHDKEHIDSIFEDVPVNIL